MPRRIVPTMIVGVLGWFVASTAGAAAAPTSGITFDPAAASPGQTVAFAATQTVARGSEGVCEIDHAGGPSDPTSECHVHADGRVDGTVVLPADAAPGTSYAVTICGPIEQHLCGSELSWGISGAVKVTPAPPPLPDVRCLSAEAAVNALRQAGISTEPVDFSGRVASTVPTAGTPTAPGADPVVLVPALVPELLGQTYPDGQALAESSCAELTTDDPTTGATISGQDPGAGTVVPPDGEVVVEMVVSPLTDPPTTRITSLPTTSGSSSRSTSSSPPSPTRRASATPSPSESGLGHRGGSSGATVHHRAWWRHPAVPTFSLLSAAGVVLGLRRLRAPGVVEPPPFTVTVEHTARSHAVSESADHGDGHSLVTIRRSSVHHLEEHP